MANRQQRRAAARAGTSLISQAADDVAIAYLHPGSGVGAAFSRSLIQLQAFDLRGARTPDGRHLGGGGHFGYHLPLESGANIVSARNMIVRQFLDQTEADWLWMIDADMSFGADTLDRLLAAADPRERPILGGLCFARIRGEAQEIVPTIYSLNADGEMVRWHNYPTDEVVRVAGTGAACLLVHRRVFQTMLDATVTEEVAAETGIPAGTTRFPPPWPWFAETITGRDWGRSMSEDLTFCLRAQSCDFPVYVDTSIQIGHTKPMEIDAALYRLHLPPAEEPAPTYVVIPVKGKQHFTEALIDQLGQQAGTFDHCFIYDNAAGTADALDAVYSDRWPWLTVIPAAGLNIHEMWNLGIKEALNRDPRCNIAILNNDLELGDDFLAELATGLRAHPSIAAVCGNYDNRQMVEKVQAVRGIAAGREDGTGGFAGFAFMVRGELFAAGFPLFDEQFELWYGDSDFVRNLDTLGASYGIVRDAKVKHIGGGSQTSGDGTDRLATAELKAMVARDRERFEQKVGS